MFKSTPCVLNSNSLAYFFGHRQTHRHSWQDCIVHMRDCLWVYSLAIATSYLGRLVDCNMSGCDLEGDIDWHMSYTVTVRSLNPTRSNSILLETFKQKNRQI